MTLSSTAEDSMRINSCPGPCFVMAGAGMCNAGRILHHLKHNLWNPETHVIIVGYQAEGTLGRLLVEGEKGDHLWRDDCGRGPDTHTGRIQRPCRGRTDLLKWFDVLFGPGMKPWCESPDSVGKMVRGKRWPS